MQTDGLPYPVKGLPAVVSTMTERLTRVEVGPVNLELLEVLIHCNLTHLDNTLETAGSEAIWRTAFQRWTHLTELRVYASTTDAAQLMTFWTRVILSPLESLTHFTIYGLLTSHPATTLFVGLLPKFPNLVWCQLPKPDRLTPELEFNIIQEVDERPNLTYLGWLEYAVSPLVASWIEGSTLLTPLFTGLRLTTAEKRNRTKNATLVQLATIPACFSSK